MLTTGKWLVRAVFAAGVVGALAFGAQQAVAAWHAKDPCVCPTVWSWEDCDDCCGPDGGLCTTGHYCVCA